MHNLKKQIAYLQGLAEGLNLDDGSKEGRVLSGIIDVLDQMAEQLMDIEEAQADLEEYVESIDEDLYELEGDVQGEELGDMEGIDYIEVECPNCRDMVTFDADIVDDEDIIEVICPSCDEVVYINDEDIMKTHEEEVRMVQDTEDI